DLPGSIEAGNRERTWWRRQATAAYEVFLSRFNADFVWHGSLFEGWGDNAVTGLGTGCQDHRQIATLYDLIPLRYPEETFQEARQRDWYYRRLALVKRCRMLFAIS